MVGLNSDYQPQPVVHTYVSACGVLSTVGLGHLTEVVVSLNPLGPRGVVSLLQCLSTEHLSILDLANTCTDLPLGPALLEDPKVLKFFTQVMRQLNHVLSAPLLNILRKPTFHGDTKFTNSVNECENCPLFVTFVEVQFH